MKTAFRSQWSTIVLMLAAVPAVVLLFNRPAESFQAESKTTKWSYHSISIAANELPAKLTELGDAGWEVFSIVRQETKVVSDGGSARLVAEKYDVSARKPKP